MKGKETILLAPLTYDQQRWLDLPSSTLCPSFRQTHVIIPATRAKFSLVIVCVFCLFGFAQDTEEDGWDLKFKDYAIKDADAFQGTPARLQIVEEKHRTFRTAITDAARKGPNFAGHYTVAEWGCGSGCMSWPWWMKPRQSFLRSL